MNTKSNRYMDYGAKYVGMKAYACASSVPTSKQRSFYNRLYYLCKTNNINPESHRGTRYGFSYAIDVMKARLENAGIPILSYNKTAGSGDAQHACEPEQECVTP